MRHWVAFAIAVIAAMGLIVWAVMVFGARLSFGVDGTQSDTAPTANNSLPPADYQFSHGIESSTPIGIIDMPRHLGNK
jgi:hypothetical protein